MIKDYTSSKSLNVLATQLVGRNWVLKHKFVFLLLNVNLNTTALDYY